MIRTRKWQCGRKLPGRLAIVVQETRKPIREIARGNNKQGNGVNVTPAKVGKFTLVIQGKKNLKRYIEALEQAWRLPIEEIRKIYREDKGRVLSQEELSQFEDWYFATKMMKTDMDTYYQKRKEALS